MSALDVTPRNATGATRIVGPTGWRLTTRRPGRFLVLQQGEPAPLSGGPRVVITCGTDSIAEVFAERVAISREGVNAWCVDTETGVVLP